jgi:DNA-binding NarL/FixJ family response regulator
MPKPGEPEGKTSPLSERECAVLRLVSQGLTNHAIALRLGIMPTTVGHHLSHIFAKLGAASRAEAVAIAVARGWLAQ